MKILLQIDQLSTNGTKRKTNIRLPCLEGWHVKKDYYAVIFYLIKIIFVKVDILAGNKR